MPTLDSVTFDTAGLSFQGERDQARVWSTPAGDGIGLYYFPLKPDIQAGLESLDDVRACFRRAAAAAGAAIIEVDTISADRRSAVRQIIKVAQEPAGMTYLGSIIIPSRDFSFVIKAQCEERGMTGSRDAIVLDEAIADGRVTIDTKYRSLRGWMQDPYIPGLCDGFQRNLAEDERYDARFPKHPLSRLRALLAHVHQTIRLSQEVHQSPPFRYPWWSRLTRAWN